MHTNVGFHPMHHAAFRPRRADYMMPTRHKLNPNWTRRGDNTKYRSKK